MKLMFKKILKWGGLTILVLYAALVVYRMFVLNAEDKTAEQVKKIHDTRLTIQDVMGENLPPQPAAPDATVQGVDANANGIRDDVELAIFKEYPDSAKTRAVLLPYALALQMEVTQQVVNEGTVTAVAEDGERAYACVGKILSRNDMKEYIANANRLRSFVETRQLNTEERKQAQTNFYEKLGSHTSPKESCDLDVASLPN